MENEFFAATKRSLEEGGVQVNVKFKMRETVSRPNLEGAAVSRLYTRLSPIWGCTLVVGAVPRLRLYVYENAQW